MGNKFLIVFAVFALYFLVVGGIVLAIYILQSLGLYKLAKRHGTQNPWLAWIPIGDIYIMGVLSKQSAYVENKVPRIHILAPAMWGIYIILCFTPAVSILFSDFIGFGNFAVLPYIGLYFLIMAFALFMAFVRCFMLYHIFKVYEPENAVLYTVLSVFGLSFVFIFVIRNKHPVTAETEKTLQSI